jgi:probable O-glycosylation ligase (exosortase A-associated)
METVVFLLFVFWMCITQLAAYDTDASYEQWSKVMKIDFMLVVAMVILHSKQHIVALAWVLVASVGYYGLKGGLFTLLTGGDYRVYGPPTTTIEGNNELALALVMTIPLARFLQLNTPSRWIRHGLTALMLLCAVAAIGSHSRGAMLAIAAMVMLLWWHSNGKSAVAAIIVFSGIALFLFMPDIWHERMGSIQTYEQDESAMGRINAWTMAWNLASDRILGGGFSIVNSELFSQYAPDPTTPRAIHSIYFQVLGEHGFVGLFLFLLMWIVVWRSAGRLRTQGSLHPQTLWLSSLGAMCQVSLVGYAVGGAFLSLAYFDLPYNLLILVVLGCRWMDSKAWHSTSVERLSLQGVGRPAT